MIARSGALAVSFVLVCCVQTPSEPASIEPEPAGRERYEGILETRSGSKLTTEELIELATRAEAHYTRELASVAQRIGTGTADWRDVFRELSQVHPETSDEVVAAYESELLRAARFVAERELVTLPPGPPTVQIAENPILVENFPLALYMKGTLGLTLTGQYGEISFENHCNACIAPLAVHEGYPGHHVAFYHDAVHRQGATLGDDVDIDGNAEALFFHEGWALYAERLMLEEGYYEGEPERELAAWRMLLLRAVRARIDAQLHSRQISREEATEQYRELLAMAPETAELEVLGHLRKPGSKASYLVGLLQIDGLKRNALPEDLGSAFHDRLLESPDRVRLVPIARQDLAPDGSGESSQ